MINRRKIEIDQIYNKIDKIAKVGSDNFLEYYIYVDSLVRKGQYNILLECLDLKYKFNSDGIDVKSVKELSWKTILFNTYTPFQESKKKLLKTKKVYQNGLFYYNDVPQTSAKVIDSTGKDCELEPVIVGGGVSSIKVIRGGSNYSATASIVITGGIGQATATPTVIAGKIHKVIIGQTGSYHNTLINLGKITEFDTLKFIPPEGSVYSSALQKFSKNKTTYLVATKTGQTQGMTFSDWSLTYTYDKNLLNLYQSAIDYLLD